MTKAMYMPVLLSLGVGSVFASGTGQAGCPCVGGNPNLLIPLESELYDQRYGTECSRHDYDREYCGPGDEWCGQAWCYVDADCVAERNGETYEAAASVIFPGSGLMWSYETCGSENLYTGIWRHSFATVQREECACTGSNKGLEGKLKDTDVGTSCFAWDANNDYCDQSHSTFKDGNEAWCPHSWCYVQENCWAERNGVKRISRPSVYENNPDAELWYSYQECGSPDNFPWFQNWQYTFSECGDRPPVDVYFLVDSSDSVESYWNGIRSGVASFIGGLDAEKGDRAGLVLFGGTTKNTQDEDMRTVSTLTSDIDALEATAQSLERLTTFGGSSQHTWTYSGINHTLSAWKDDEERAGNFPFLVIVTDGAPNPAARENPCDPNINFAHPRSDIVDMGIKTLIYQIGELFNTLDCLVDDPNEDIVVIPDANHFFDGIKKNVFCNSLITDTPTAVPTPAPTPAPTVQPTEECVMKCFEKVECSPVTMAPSAPVVDSDCSGVEKMSKDAHKEECVLRKGQGREACEEMGCTYVSKNGKCRTKTNVLCADLSEDNCCKFNGCVKRSRGKCGGSFTGF